MLAYILSMYMKHQHTCTVAKRERERERTEYTHTHTQRTNNESRQVMQILIEKRESEIKRKDKYTMLRE